MRKRINRACIASSSNYAQSRKVHREYIIEQHYKNAIVLEQISTISIRKRAFVQCFGVLIPITIEEAHRLENTIIIWK